MFDKLAELRVLPVVAADTVDQGLHLCEALCKGGLPAVEITFRTSAAEQIIRSVTTTFPDMIVGAGTILTVADLERAVAAGASFGVAPGCNPRVVKAAVEASFPFAPGVCTPSDVEQALEYGVVNLKFFPAEASGGVTFLKALAGPYGHLGLSFCPTGGINLDNMLDYLALPQVPFVAGTWLAKKHLLAAGEWQTITNLAAEAVEKAS